MNKKDFLKNILEHSKMIHEFVYYDRPLFFSVRMPNNEIYLLLWSDCNEKTEFWLNIRVSEDNYNNMLNDKIDILSTILLEKEAFLIAYSNTKTRTRVITLENIKDKWLPDSNVFINGDFKNRH